MEGRAPVDQHVLRAGLRPDDAGEDLGGVLQRPRHPQRQHHHGAARSGRAGRGMRQHGFRRHVEGGRPGPAQGAGAIGGRGCRRAPPGRGRSMPACSGTGSSSPPMTARRGRRPAKALGSPEDLRVCRLQLHSDGSLFVVVTALRQGGKFLADGPGLYRSKDGARTWEIVNKAATAPLAEGFHGRSQGQPHHLRGRCRCRRQETGRPVPHDRRRGHLVAAGPQGTRAFRRVPESQAPGVDLHDADRGCPRCRAVAEQGQRRYLVGA